MIYRCRKDDLYHKKPNDALKFITSRMLFLLRILFGGTLIRYELYQRFVQR